MRRLLFPIALVLLLFAACNKTGPKQIRLHGKAKVAATSLNMFAFDLYQQLSTERGNLFFSPASISTALTMTWAGTAGPTALETAEVLHLEGEPNQVMADFSKLLGQFAGSDTTFTLEVANRLWGQKDYPFKSAYLSEIDNFFDGGFEACSFKSDANLERKKINRWVAQNTADKIQNLMPPGSIDTNTRLVLTNAVYFLGQWKNPFPVKRTADEIFHPAEGPVLNTPTMKLKKRLPYFSNKEMAMVALPYQGDELELVVILPNKNSELAPVLANLNSATFETSLAAMVPREVDVWLPKLNLEEAINLNQALKKLGLQKVFQKEHADFSRMSPKTGLFVSSVVHQSYLMVDEQGTEAAASTGITIGVTSMPAPPTMFVADHPFLFTIVHKDSGAILFMGRFEQP